MPKKYKVGDVVFVVPLLTREQVQRGESRTGREAAICKVGRRWAYLAGKGTPFDVATGMSRDDLGTDRCNGWGYDVYESREQWERVDAEFKARDALKKRLDVSWSSRVIDKLSHDQVQRITAILGEVSNER